MGTRGACGFRIKGQDKVTYNHFDSYPSGLGQQVIDFIRETTDEDLLKIAANIVLVRRDDKPTEEQKALCRAAGTIDLGVSGQTEDEWYCLLRGAQGDLGVYKSVPFMIDDHGFLTDSLFCEWAYIVNVDEDTLEVYKGFNKRAGGAGRYANLQNDDYYGIVLLDVVSLSDVREGSPEYLIEKWNKLAYGEED